MQATTPEARLKPAETLPVVQQHEIIQALIGAPTVRLHHFLAAQEAPAALPSALPQVAWQTRDGMSLEDGGADAALARLRRRQQKQRLHWQRALLGLTAIGGLCAGLWLAAWLGPSTPPSATPWEVIAVQNGGVLVRIDRASEPIAVPIGGLLPDGTRLTATDAQRSIYSTPQRDVRLRPTTPAATSDPSASSRP